MPSPNLAATADTIATARPISLADYFDELDSFDWLFGYSDDPEVYRRCYARRDELRKLATLSEEHGRLFKLFDEWGGDWKCQPKFRDPECPAKPSRPE